MSERPWDQPADSSATPGPRFPPPVASSAATYPRGHQPSGPPAQVGNAAPPYPQAPWPAHPIQPLPGAAAPNPNWPWSVASLVPFAGLGCAIVAIIFSAQVQGKFQSGDIAGAQRASNNARTWAIIGIVINVLALLSLASQMPY